MPIETSATVVGGLGGDAAMGALAARMEIDGGDSGDSDGPEGLRVSELEVAGQPLLVFSYPVELPDLADGTPLTPAEAGVAELAIAGFSNAEIAARRGVSRSTVANQMACVLRKLDVASRRELAVRYLKGDIAAE